MTTERPIGSISKPAAVRTSKMKPSASHELDKNANVYFYVPKDILPYLDRITTRQYEEYIGDGAEHASTCVRLANNLVDLPPLNWFMGMVILVNTVVLIVETDRMATAGDAPQEDMLWAAVVGWIVLGIFIFELIIRLIAFRAHFWRDMANVFDFMIVSLDACLSILAFVAGSRFPVSMLRVFRLAKFARVSKVFFVFPELRLLLAGLMSSMSAIFWGTILLCFFLIVWSMVAVLFINPLNQQIDYENCERCSRAYSSVAHSSLTFWQSIVIGDSWGQSTIPLIEKHPITAVYFVGVYLTIGMGVTNLILGVIVNVAEQTRDELKLEDTTKNTLSKMKKRTRLFELCRRMDLDKNGVLSKEELVGAFQEPGEFRESVIALNINEEDFDLVWTLVDPDNKGAVSYKELVSQLASLRSSDTHFMLCYIKYYITALRHELMGAMKQYHPERLRHEEILEAEVQQVKQKEDTILIEERMLSQMTEKIEEELHNMEPAISPNVRPPSFIKASPVEPILEGFGSCDITALTDSTSRIRQSMRTNDITATSRASASADAQIETCIQRVCDDIAKVRIELKDVLTLELKDILTEINRKFGQKLCEVSSMSHSILRKIQKAEPELHGVVPDAMPPYCSSRPVEKLIVPKVMSGSGQHCPEEGS